MQLKNGNVIMFLCDRKACGGTCPNKDCSHTSDISHAKNFDFVHVSDKLTDYFEVESDVEDIVRRVLAEEKSIA